VIKTVNRHDRKTRAMSLKPGLIGLDNIVLSTEESLILTPNGDLLGAPDNLMFDPTTHTLYQIEYKCNDTNAQYQKAKYQLKRNQVVLQALFDTFKVVNLYVHGQFDVERIK